MNEFIKDNRDENRGGSHSTAALSPNNGVTQGGDNNGSGDLERSVILSVDERGVANVTLNRGGRHNAFDDLMIAELSDVFKRLGEDHNVRIVTLRGAGKSFSAGADMNWMKRAASYTAPQNKADALALATMLQRLYDLPQLTIACVQGAAMGGGFGLAACCDIVLADKETKFALSETKIGLIPATIGPFVMHAIGARQMRRYAQSAELLNAEKAKDIGLVHEICNDLDTTCADIIEHALQNAPSAMKASKQLCHDLQGAPLNTQTMEMTAQRIADIRSGGEAKEGLSAFLEKRKPNWCTE